MQEARDERIEEIGRGCGGPRDPDLYVWLDQPIFWSCKNLLQKARKRVYDVGKKRML